MNRSHEPRHKCHNCGAVRYESEMEKLPASEVQYVVDARFGNSRKLWKCRTTNWRKCWRS